MHSGLFNTGRPTWVIVITMKLCNTDSQTKPEERDSCQVKPPYTFGKTCSSSTQTDAVHPDVLGHDSDYKTWSGHPQLHRGRLATEEMFSSSETSATEQVLNNSEKPEQSPPANNLLKTEQRHHGDLVRARDSSNKVKLARVDPPLLQLGGHRPWTGTVWTVRLLIPPGHWTGTVWTVRLLIPPGHWTGTVWTVRLLIPPGHWTGTVWTVPLLIPPGHWTGTVWTVPLLIPPGHWTGTVWTVRLLIPPGHWTRTGCLFPLDHWTWTVWTVRLLLLLGHQTGTV